MKIDFHLLKSVWPQDCYYSIDIDGQILPGKRPWQERWQLFQKLQCQGKRTIDLGCNLGLLPIFLSASGAEATGVDFNKTLLSKAKIVAAAYGVSCRFEYCDFNSPDWESQLGTNFDLASACSVIRWIHDKNRFLQYLSSFKGVVWEGYNEPEKEIDTFKNLGFSHATILGRTKHKQIVFFRKIMM